MHLDRMHRVLFMCSSAVSRLLMCIMAMLGTCRYEQMWEDRMPGGAAAWQPKTLEQQLSRWDRHTKDCVVCQKVAGGAADVLCCELFCGDACCVLMHLTHMTGHCGKHVAMTITCVLPLGLVAYTCTCTRPPDRALQLKNISMCCMALQEYAKLTKLCGVLNAVGIALGAIAVALTAATRGSDPRAYAIAAVSALLLLGRNKLAGWRDSALLSSAKQWRAVGGLSLVEGVPVKL